MIRSYIHKQLKVILHWIDDQRYKRVFTQFASTDPAHIPTHTTNYELRSLYLLAKSLPMNANVIEIGSYLGASTCYLAAGLAKKNGKIYCIDTWQNETMPEGIRDTFAEFLTNTAAFKDMIVPIRKRSDSTSPDELPSRVALVFIDGDHSYKAVKNDFDLVSARMMNNGIVAFHDHKFFEGVRRVIAEALLQEYWVISGMTHNLIWMRKESHGSACPQEETASAL